MNASKRKRLESAGWAVGNTKEFLNLSEEEVRIVEMKVSLATTLKRHRIRRRWTQLDLAKRLGSSQSRVAKLESGAPGATLDLLFRAIFATGMSLEDVAKEMRPRKRSAA